ncbi:hypothetical protein BW730_14235 [Tessaracoccus aquimaris]|uniref:YobI-like P-loop NTPase domain-containing protein n=1 Tax=Tessaracoccus aquimaris TaxID=1332264 RepID=A0A1Q2CQW3_9ACTN|nr:hypothetical protein BW730_14235 [Tessaracoccus aquimaris]
MARFVTDYRLILSIVNEYRVLERVVRGETGLKELDRSRLFAMAAYKTLRPSDYDGILAGSSPLNRFQQSFDDLKVTALEVLSEAESRVRSVSSLPGQGARARLGAALSVMVDRLNGQATERSGQRAFDPSAPDDVAFWKGAVEAGVRIGAPRLTVDLRPDDLAIMAGEAGGAIAWDEARNEAKTRDLENLNEWKTWVSRATWQDMMRPPRSLYLAATDETIEGFTLSDLSEMGIDKFTAALIARGYIDSLFTIYAVRTDPGELTAKALNYLILVVEDPKGQPLFEYEFDNDDAVRRMLKAAGPEFLADERCLNVQVYDHLVALPASDSDSPFMLTSCAPSELARRFRRLYRSKGAHIPRFAKLAAPNLTSAFVEVADEAMDPEKVTAVLEATLVGASPDRVYDSNEAVTNALSKQALPI